MSVFKFISEFISKKENLINSVSLYCLAFLSALNIVFWNVSLVDKVSIAGGATILTFMFMININHLKIWQFCLALLNMLSLTMTLILNKGVGVGVVLTAFYLIVSIILYNTVTFDKKAINISRYITCSAILILFATSKYRKSLSGNWIHISDRISGNNINNNSICILIVALIFLLIVLLKKYYENKEKGSLLTVGIIAILGIAFAYPFGGRIAITSIALFFILLMMRGIKIKTSLYKPLCIMIFLLAIIIPIIYIQLYNVIDDFNFMGKDFFTGRQYLWRLTFEHISEHPVFGSGTTLLLDNGGSYITQSAHNTMLGLWKNVGIIPLITLIICFFRRRYEYINLEDRAILAFLIIMFTESFFMDSHFTFIFLIFMPRSHDQVESDLPKTRFGRWLDQTVLSIKKGNEIQKDDT